MTGAPAGTPSPAWDHAPRRTPRSSFVGLTVNRDLPDLTPRESKGRADVGFDFDGVSIGCAEYAEGPTGVTVLQVEGGARTHADLRGGAVGVSGGYELNHAVCLAGGSVHGLAAAAGVTDVTMERRGRRTGFADLALVSGAVVYDLGCRDNAITPDAALGRAAVELARTGYVPVGRVGAGVAVTVGKTRTDGIEWSGQGAAFATIGPAKFLALTVVNAVGVVTDRDGTVLRGGLTLDGSREHPAVASRQSLEEGSAGGAHGGNTTLSVMLTNVAMGDADLAQFGRQVHSSMHRAIQPFHTHVDGDVLFAMTTDEVTLPDSIGPDGLGTHPIALGTVASEVLWDAVIEAVR